jgi:hypothetical protein
MKVLQCPDIIASCLPFPLRLSVRMCIAALGTLVVLGAQLLQTTKPFERKKETNKTFDNALGLQTITRETLECRDIVRLARGAWLMIVLNNVTKKDMR